MNGNLNAIKNRIGTKSISLFFFIILNKIYMMKQIICTNKPKRLCESKNTLSGFVWNLATHYEIIFSVIFDAINIRENVKRRK